ncbi:MAG: hypothetical protein ABI255_00085 [Microbacteriaceae bacterium]
MDKFWPTAIVVAIVVVAFIAMWRAWRARLSRGSAFGSGYRAPDSVVDLATFEVIYVATTAHLEPLERLAMPGLGYRGVATLALTNLGITISVRGEQSVYLPASAIVQIDTATATVDKVVEPGGLLVLSWLPERGDAEPSTSTITPEPVDSYIRVVDPADRVRLIAAIEELTSGTTTESEA